MTDSTDDTQSASAKRPPRRRKPVHGNPAADPVQVHRDYVARRLWSGDERDDGDVSGLDEVGSDAGSDVSSASDRDAPVEPGAAPDLSEHYARAVDQWHQLPGAVSTPPTEVAPAAPELAPADDDPPDEQEES